MRSKQEAPYGSWPSPITPDLLLGSSVGLGEIQHFSDELYWIEMRTEEGGRYVIVKRQPDGQQADVITADYNARTRVHEYGGASYLITAAGLFFCHFNDQAIYRLQENGQCQRVTNNPACRYADMIFDERRRRLVCVREEHRDEEREATNTIVAIDIDDGAETILAEGADFYSAPRLSPDCSQLCWVAWLHPNMPWDTTSLYLADLDEQGSMTNVTSVTAGIDESVTQPAWSPRGTLFYVSDKNGWWNLYCYEDGRSRCVLTMQAEFAVPQWSFGEQNYDFIDADTLLASYWQDGVAALGKLDLGNGTLETIDLPYTDMESVVCKDKRAWFLAAAPDAFPAIIELNLDNHSCSVLRKANELAVDAGFISVGQSVCFTAEGRDVHAFYYAPANRDFIGPQHELPPLIVISHGGPTGASHNGLKMVVQYFTSRGFAVIDVNYGGSTGYGREYRQRLLGNWGIVDVNDCSEAALYAARQGWVDSERLAIRGGSAGGFTTLAALAFTDVFKAGASHYGVSDLEALAKETHKFESRYLDSLLGPYPEAQDIYRQRSPINAISGLSCPVIFFQGLEDKIVLPNQAEMMVNALKEKGIPVAYLAYEGEQHGFRQAKNIKRTLESELYFYSRIFDFECADELEPVSFV